LSALKSTKHYQLFLQHFQFCFLPNHKKTLPRKCFANEQYGKPADHPTHTLKVIKTELDHGMNLTLVN